MYTGKLTLTNTRRTPFSLSNHFDDTFGLVDSIKECKSAEGFCKIANKYHKYRRIGNVTWHIDNDCAENTRLKYVDTLGNIFYLIAKKEEEKHKNTKCFTSEEIEIITKALIEYEENHYETEGSKWQKTINNLIKYLK